MDSIRTSYCTWVGFALAVIDRLHLHSRGNLFVRKWYASAYRYCADYLLRLIFCRHWDIMVEMERRSSRWKKL